MQSLLGTKQQQVSTRAAARCAAVYDRPAGRLGFSLAKCRFWGSALQSRAARLRPLQSALQVSTLLQHNSDSSMAWLWLTTATGAAVYRRSVQMWLLLAAVQLPMQQLSTWAGQSWNQYCLRAGELAHYNTDGNTISNSHAAKRCVHELLVICAADILPATKSGCT